MPTIQCPLDGFEDVKVTYPDEWLYKHIDVFYRGIQSAPDNSSPGTQELLGTLALCDDLEGIDIKNIDDLPIKYRQVFRWLVRTVYIDSYLQAITIPNE